MGSRTEVLALYLVVHRALGSNLLIT